MCIICVSPAHARVIYAGVQKHVFRGITVFGWNQVDRALEKIVAS